MSSCLAVNVSSLGDLISSLPVLEGLKAKFDGVDLVCVEAFRGLIEDEPGIRLIDWSEAESRAYDLIVDLTSSGFTRRKMARLKAKSKAGRADGWIKRLKARRVYDHLVAKTPHKNLVKDYLPLAEILDLKIPEFPLLTPPTEVDLPTKAQEFLNSPGLKVSFHPFSKDKLRTLPVELKNAIVRELESRGARIFLIGSPNEIPPDNRLPYAALSLRQLKAVLGGSDFFIGGDSGPLHLAAALKIPSLGVFGPTIPEMTKPLAPWSLALEKSFSCRPCNTQKPCRFEHRCLRQILIEDLREGLSQLFNRGS